MNKPSDTKTDIEAESAASKGRLAEARDKAAEIASDVKLRASEVADDVRHAASAKADELRVQANEAYESARIRARGYRADGEDYVRRNPRQSLLTALAAGFVCGLIWRR